MGSLRFSFESADSFGPETVAAMAEAYNVAWRSLMPRQGLTSEALAECIIDLVRQGVHDSHELGRQAIIRMSDGAMVYQAR